MRPENLKQNERVTALYEAILRLNTLDECIQFFDDLCAVTELRTLEQRYAVAGCLLQGKVYSEIRRETGASSATVSRAEKWPPHRGSLYPPNLRKATQSACDGRKWRSRLA